MAVCDVKRVVGSVEGAARAVTPEREVCCGLIVLGGLLVGDLIAVLSVGLFIPQGNAILSALKSSTKDACRRLE